MSESGDDFQDPQLQSALSRAFAGHRASPELRGKVEAIFASPDAFAAAPGAASPNASTLPRAQTRPWFLGPRLLAAAAVLIVAIGGSTMYVRHVLHERHEVEEHAEYDRLNRPLLAGMIATHQGAYLTDASRQAATASLSEPRALAENLSGMVSRQVPAVEFPGWTVLAAGFTQIGPVQGAHWKLTRPDGKSVTVVSIPSASFAGADEYEDGYDYAYVIDGHPIAGFLRKGGVHCVVCDPTMTSEDSIALREQLKRG